MTETGYSVRLSLKRREHMHHTPKLALLMASVVFAALPLLSQTAPGPKSAFEVISIKPTPPGTRGRGGGPRNDRFSMTGATLKMLLQAAYQRSTPAISSDFEIIGGPSWMDSDQYDIEAKA